PAIQRAQGVSQPHRQRGVCVAHLGEHREHELDELLAATFAQELLELATDVVKIGEGTGGEGRLRRHAAERLSTPRDDTTPYAACRGDLDGGLVCGCHRGLRRAPDRSIPSSISASSAASTSTCVAPAPGVQAKWKRPRERRLAYSA